MKHKAQVYKRVRKANYHWNPNTDACFFCGKNWTHVCSSHPAADNLAIMLVVREEDGVEPSDLD